MQNYVRALKQGTDFHVAYTKYLLKASDATKNFVNEQDLFKDKVSSSTTSVEELTASFKANSIGAKAAALATQTLGLALQAAIGIGISILATKIIEVINNYIHRFELATEAVNAMNDRIKELNDNLTEQKKLVDEASESYADLAKHVDSTTNANISLSTEDYEKFVSLNKQLAESFPSLITGIGENNTLLLDLGNTAEEVADKLNDAYEEQQKLANYKISKELTDGWSDTQLAFEKFQSNVDDAQKQFEKFQESLVTINSINMAEKADFYVPNEVAGELESQLESIFHDVIGEDLWRELIRGSNKYDLKFEDIFSLGNETDEFGNQRFIWDLTKLADLDIDTSVIENKLTELRGVLNEQLTEARMELSDAKSVIRNEYLNLLPSATAMLVSMGSYNDTLSEEAQNLALSFMNSFNEEFMAGAVASDDLKQYIQDNIIAPMVELSNDQEAMNLFQNVKNADTPAAWKDAWTDFKNYIGEDKVEVYLDFVPMPNQELYDAGRKSIGKILTPIANSQDDYNTEYEKLSAYYDKLGAEEQEVWNRFADEYQGHWRDFIKDFEVELQNIQAEVREQDIVTAFSSQDFSENLTSKLSKVQSAYSDFYQNVIEGEQKAFDIDTFESLRTELVKGVEDEDGNKNIYGLSPEQFKEYEDIITNTTYSVEEQKHAWEELSTALANNYYNQAIAETGILDEQTKQLIKDQLELKGYTEESIDNFIKFKSLDSTDFLDSMVQKSEVLLVSLQDVYKTTADDTKQIIGDMMDELAEGGIDLKIRPQIDAKELEDVGWEDVGEGVATIFSSTFSNEVGDLAINLTPITPDGKTILSPSDLEDYAEHLLNGGDDYLQLQIGVEFHGDNAIEQASRVAESLHILQSAYYNAADADELFSQLLAQNEPRLRTEAAAVGLTTQEYLAYTIQKQLANENVLDTSNDNTQLIALIGMLKATGVEVAGLSELISALSNQEIMPEERRKAIVNAAKSRLPETFKIDIDFDPSKLKDATKGTKAAADAAEDLEDVLSKINAQIDEIQDSYQKLNKIQETYNETGHISVDQAQELSNMDFRYLALLKTEGDALDANKDAFDNLTEAKVAELRVALIRKAMDLISTFTDESVAAEYLRNSYLDAADAGLTLLDVMNQINGMDLGEQGREAAMQVYQGLENAWQMIGDIDVNLDTSSSRESTDHSSVDHSKSEKSPEQEAFEKEVKEAEESINVTFKDWMEVALDRVAKRVDKWTKSIDRMTKFWNKNWATNKAINATREQIDLQKAAYNLYKGQAVKAARKAGRYIESNDETMTYEILGEENLSKLYTNLITNGANFIEEFDGSEKSKRTLKQIEAFMEWFNKAISAQEAIDELYEQERQLIKSKLDNIVDYYDTISGYLDSFAGRIDAAINLKEAKGQRTTVQDLLAQYRAQDAIVNNAREALTALTTGITKETARERSEIEADIAKHAATFSVVDTLKNNETYTAKAETKRNSLQESLDTYNELMAQAEQASTKKEAKALKKQAKKYKLSTNQKNLLSYLNKNLDTISELGQNTLVDTTVANTATYQNIVNEISKLQGKKKLSPSNQKKLNMYLDELQAMNNGILAEDVVAYQKTYQDWWKLDQEYQKNGYFKDASKYTKYEKLTAAKEGFEKSHKDQMEGFQRELEQLDAIDQNKVEEYTTARDEALEELEESYDEQISGVEDSYKDNKGYNTIYGNYKKLADQKASGKKLTKKQEKKLAKYEAELAALQEGATDENFAEYKKTWEKFYDLDLIKQSGKQLTAKQAKLYDQYKAQLDQWNLEKQDSIQSLEAEYIDAYDELKEEWDAKIEDAQAELDNQLSETYQIIKQIAEQAIVDLEREIESLDAMISRFKDVANLFENISSEKILKYNGISSLLGISGSDSASIISDQLSKTISETENKVNQQIAKGNVYQELVNAARSGSFETATQRYRSMLTNQEDIDALDDAIKLLNESGKDATEWIAEWNKGLSDSISELSSTIQEVQALKDEFRENVTFKAVNTAINQLSSMQNRMASMASLFQDDWLTDVNGLTEMGKAKAAALTEEYATAQQLVQEYANKVAKIQESGFGVGNSAYATQEDYQKALNEELSNYYNQMVSVENIAKELYQLSKSQTEAEINQLKKLATARQNALNKKKAYYDYNKTLQEKQKSIEALQAEIDALNGVIYLLILF